MLYIYRPEFGTNKKLDVESAGNASHPTWAPDGTRIAFADGDGCPQCYGVVISVVSLTTGRTHRVTSPRASSRADQKPVWSPTGKWIAFERTSFRDHSTEPVIALIRPDGSGLRLLTRGHGPSWSPDGQRIAFANGQRLYLIDLKRSKPRLIAQVRTGLLALKWSPDGRAFLYATDDGIGPYTLWRMNSDGTNPEALVSSRCPFTGLTWRPN